MVSDTPLVTATAIRIGLRASDRQAAAQAVAAAFDAYAPSLKGFASAALRDPEAAEDLVQEAFLRLIRELQAGRRLENIRGWLFAVCANLAVSQARRRSVRDRLRFRLVERESGASPEEVAVRRDDDAELRAALGRLRVEERMALLLSASGLSASEVGEAIGRTPNATRAFICRARMRLRAELLTREQAER